MIQTLLSKLGELIGNAMTWAFAGAIFGGAFVALHNYWLTLGAENWLAIIWSSVLAGTVTAGFFGSLVVALAGTLTGILVAITYQILFSSFDRPELLMIAAATLGLIAGAFFSRRELAQYQPLGQASSGFIAGLFAGLLLTGVGLITDLEMNDFLLALIAVGLVGSSYVFFSRHIPISMREGMALSLGGPVVCAVISVGVAFAFWLIGESMDLHWSHEPISRYFNVLTNVPSGAAGGAVGGAIGGAGMAILGIRIQRHMYAD